MVKTRVLSFQQFPINKMLRTFTKTLPRPTMVLPASRMSSTASDTHPRPRPVSPHVQIYKFPPSAIASIMNRATGVGLSVAIVSAGMISIAGGDVLGVVHGMKTNVSLLVPVTKFCLAFPLVYHTLGGLRHLYWDKTAKGLDSAAEANTSSYILIGTSTVAGLLLAGYSY